MRRSFRGGVHPAPHKDTAALAVETMPLLGRYVVPLAQHLGAPGEVCVAKGERVERGQPLSRPQGFVSVPVHAPTSGVVKSVKEQPHPHGRALLAVEIEADGEDRPWSGRPTPADWRALSPGALIAALRDAGLVGMGGAAFPTHVKLSPPEDKPIDLVILNGAECEPYLSSDHRVMLEEAPAVMAGLGIMLRALGAQRALVGVEANKADAADALSAACPVYLDADVALLPVKYPQGSEKQLIRALTRRTVPEGGLPMDVGCLVQNVGTAAAAFRALSEGEPLIERVVTVAGDGVAVPRNLRVRVGTPLADVIGHCGGLAGDVAKVIVGGPMMGMAQHSLDVPVLKSTSGILCLPAAQVSQFLSEPCLRCGACVDACPMALLPSALGLLAERGRYGELESHHVADCIECGSCAYACPSHRPLVQLIRRGKAERLAARRRAA